MLKNKSFLLLFAVTYLSSTNSFRGFPEAPRQDLYNQPELNEILKKSSAYCERLSNSVLYFVCHEEVQELINPINITEVRHRLSRRRWKNIRRFQTNKFIYDYQLVRKDGEIKEVRQLVEKNGEKLKPGHSELDTLRFRHKNIIMGPIVLLKEIWQYFNDYKIVKKEQYEGDQVIILEITPKPGYVLGHLYGKAWIQESDGSVIKIEWGQNGIDGYEELAAIAKTVQMEPRIILCAEYAYEKNSLRFPRKFRLEETYVGGEGRKVTNSITTVEYKDYKFFTVETEVKY